MSELPSPAVSKRVSLQDVADVVGVSHVCVSLALRGDSRVSLDRRSEIVSVAQRLGYRPDPMLSSLAAYRWSKRPAKIGSTIAWLNQWDDPVDLHRLHEFEAYWQGAQAMAKKLGYKLEEIKIGRDLSGRRLQQIFETRLVRGLVIPPHPAGISLPDFAWSRFPVVRLGISVKEPRAHVVTSDQALCAAIAVERVHERGYQRIGYISSPGFDRNTGGKFRAGFLGQQGLLPTSCRPVPPLFLEENPTTASARLLRTWLRRWKPDALITTLRALRQLLHRLDLHVPQDIAVCAMSVLDGNFDSGLDQNSFEIGVAAMQTLAGLIYQNERGIPDYCEHILVEPRWVDGTSLPLR